ncbi:MAG: hypothetical protein WC701_06225 [Kiritimatiellales bacterium]|jgi:hypothetical protein
MDTISLVIGAITALVATIIVLVKAFETGFLWGLAVLLIPYAGLIYVFLHLHGKHIAVKLYLISIFFFIAAMIFQNT